MAGLAIPGVFALASFFWPPWLWVGLMALAVTLTLVGLDYSQSRTIPAPCFSFTLPKRGRVGANAEIMIHLKNTADVPRDVVLLLEFPGDLGGDAMIEPGLMYPNEEQQHVLYRVPTRRGLRPLGPSQILARSRLGLYWVRSWSSEPKTFAVLPDPGVSEAASMSDSRLESRLGIRPRRPRGEGMEFESLREYVVGDDPRHLDWRASARTGKLITRQYQVERNHNIIICVDTGRLMSARIDGVSKLDHALRASIALSYAARSSGDHVGFLAFDREIRSWVAPIERSKSMSPMLDATLPLEVSPYEARFRVLADLLARHQKKRALIVVLTDFVEGASSAALESYVSLLSRRHVVLLVAVRDPILSGLHPKPDIDAPGVYQRLVVQDLIIERETALARFRRLGVQTLDLQPDQVTAPLLASYLEIRNAGLL